MFAESLYEWWSLHCLLEQFQMFVFRWVFRENAEIDCYQIIDGKYLGSVHLPYLSDEKAKSFRVVGDRILVIYKGLMAVYSISDMGSPF